MSIAPGAIWLPFICPTVMFAALRLVTSMSAALMVPAVSRFALTVMPVSLPVTDWSPTTASEMMADLAMSLLTSATSMFAASIFASRMFAQLILALSIEPSVMCAYSASSTLTVA